MDIIHTEQGQFPKSIQERDIRIDRHDARFDLKEAYYGVRQQGQTFVEACVTLQALVDQSDSIGSFLSTLIVSGAIALPFDVI